jgi:hypothetical protein
MTTATTPHTSLHSLNPFSGDDARSLVSQLDEPASQHGCAGFYFARRPN